MAILKYWKFIVGGLAVLSLLGGLWYYGHTKYQEGYKAAVSQYTAKKIDVMEKRNEIANNRPDDSVTIKRLQMGAF